MTLRNKELIPSSAQHGVVTVGNFDGVHRGHLMILNRVMELAKQVSGPSVVMTFDPPPAKLLRPETVPPVLTTLPRRKELLHKLGIDQVIVYPTSMALLELEPKQFFHDFFITLMQAKGIVEGKNFRFGKDRQGDTELLERWCAEHNIHFSKLELHSDGNQWISSTRIRALIEQGNIADANRMLIEPYRLCGTVAHGAARGRTLGYPTANLSEIEVLLPPHGVYAGRVAGIKKSSSPELARDASSIGLPVALNIGPNPTFGEHSTKVEAHVVGFSGDIYGHQLEIELLERIRPVKKFESKDHLLVQLQQDVAMAVQHAKPTPPI